MTYEAGSRNWRIQRQNVFSPQWTGAICFIAVCSPLRRATLLTQLSVFPAPISNRPGTRWHYRTDSATNQGCWYIKELSASSGEAATSGPSVTPKRYNESTAPRQRQRSKSEQQTKVAQRKSEREQSESDRALHTIASILEAAGDKPVLSPPMLRGQDLQKAIEAIGDKDVVIAPTDRQEDWQQALYEEFLRWRLRQLIPQ
jgi:hypothetical protein